MRANRIRDGRRRMAGAPAIGDFLGPVELLAARRVIRLVMYHVPTPLVLAALFGSRARGDWRADSDVDLLLLFDWLPADREPHATIAERIADDVTALTGVPASVWSVSIADLAVGNRTPMLVDALADAVPVWRGPHRIGRVPFTAPDALFCGRSLLARVDEGSGEFAVACARKDWGCAATRARGDIVRLCTAWLLFRGETRPRRADAIRRFARIAFGSGPPANDIQAVLDWAASSFGPDGRDESTPVSLPSTGLTSLGAAIDQLRDMVWREGTHLSARADGRSLEGY